jgi:hypothetical protein
MDTDLLVAVALVVATQIALAIWLRSELTARPRAGALGTGRGEERGPADVRSYQAVASEVAKRQVSVLAEMADEVQSYERACLAHARRVCELLIAEWRRAGAHELAEQVPGDLVGVMRVVTQLRGRSLDEAAQARIRKDLEPNTTVLLAYAEQASHRLEENRFWLGRALEQELRDYVAGLATTFSELGPAPQALQRSEERYQALLRMPPEAARAIEKLSAGALSAIPTPG